MATVRINPMDAWPKPKFFWPPHRKLTILCLHGYRQSEDLFRNKLLPFRSELPYLVECAFISAPNIVKHERHELLKHSWWFSSPDDTFSPSDTEALDNGIDDSITLIRDNMRSLFRKPFDGILGFSQGAAMASIICALREIDPFQYDFKFAILVSGFVSPCPKHYKYYRSKLKCPSLHVFGARDSVVPKEWSEELAARYEDPVFFRHGGGHYMPQAASDLQVYDDFLRPFL